MLKEITISYRTIDHDGSKANEYLNKMDIETLELIICLYEGFCFVEKKDYIFNIISPDQRDTFKSSFWGSDKPNKYQTIHKDEQLYNTRLEKLGFVINKNIEISKSLKIKHLNNITISISATKECHHKAFIKDFPNIYSIYLKLLEHKNIIHEITDFLITNKGKNTPDVLCLGVEKECIYLREWESIEYGSKEHWGNFHIWPEDPQFRFKEYNMADLPDDKYTVAMLIVLFSLSKKIWPNTTFYGEPMLSHGSTIKEHFHGTDTFNYFNLHKIKPKEKPQELTSW